MDQINNHLLKGKYGKSIPVDIYWKTSIAPLPILVFAHGFKGFKDWGHWEAIAKKFVEAGYCFVKFNFSHNGTTPDNPLDFVDLEAFGQNNYSKELDDLQTVLDWIVQAQELRSKINCNTKDINLIGHSRGGPIALIATKENDYVQRVITWAGVHELNYAWQQEEEKIKQWEKDGVYYVLNGRTKQNMPLYYQLFEDYQKNAKRLSIKNTLQDLNKPYLIVHGSADPAVPVDAANYLLEHAANAELCLIDGANHVFGGQHPFDKKHLPKHTQELIVESLSFLKKKGNKNEKKY
ncbi:S9 family peptidase [Aureispira sp. CCB-QB1]|uniref:alpha/beta hydrolase family protein n=1 Tax=Aureispira sp. CCB-QB1 TaxID=1313421 RepID=UPI000697C9F8|nr:alpha/beta hydrolase [Aureispira sp. CCB-QB1]